MNNKVIVNNKVKVIVNNKVKIRVSSIISDRTCFNVSKSIQLFKLL